MESRTVRKFDTGERSSEYITVSDRNLSFFFLELLLHTAIDCCLPSYIYTIMAPLFGFTGLRVLVTELCRRA